LKTQSYQFPNFYNSKYFFFFLILKLRYNQKDEIGVILVGTKETRNQLNTSYQNQYKNITVLQDIKQTNIDLFKSIEDLEEGNANGDLLDSLIIATDMIMTKTGKHKWDRRIFIVTDGTFFF
jgi:ATP-dependent DNA helicase 2 subunit 2